MSSGRKTVRVLLVDDHPVVREGIRSWLDGAHSIHVVGEAGDGVEAIRLAKTLAPHVILLDMNMPRMNGLETARKLRQVMPAAALLALTVPSTREQVRHVLALGAKGYVLKDAAPGELVRAIHAVAGGQVYFSNEAAQLLFENGESKSETKFDLSSAALTPREVEVLKRIAEGASTKEIASGLGISVRTVEAHRASLMRKLNIHTFAGLTRYAVSTGISQL